MFFCSHSIQQQSFGWTTTWFDDFNGLLRDFFEELLFRVPQTFSDVSFEDLSILLFLDFLACVGAFDIAIDFLVDLRNISAYFGGGFSDVVRCQLTGSDAKQD